MLLLKFSFLTLHAKHHFFSTSKTNFIMKIGVYNNQHVGPTKNYDCLIVQNRAFQDQLGSHHWSCCHLPRAEPRDSHGFLRFLTKTASASHQRLRFPRKFHMFIGLLYGKTWKNNKYLIFPNPDLRSFGTISSDHHGQKETLG